MSVFGAAIAALFIFLASSQAANAQVLSPLCILINTGVLDAPFVPAGNSSSQSATGVANAGEVVLFLWDANATNTGRLNGAIQFNTTVSPQSITLPAGAAVTVQRTFIANGGANATLDVTCSAGGGVPPTPPTPPTTPTPPGTPGAGDEIGSILDEILIDQSDGGWQDVKTFVFPHVFDRSGNVSEDSAFNATFFGGLTPPADPDNVNLTSPITNANNAAFELSVFGFEPSEIRASNYAPRQSPINPSVTAISNYFDFGGDSISGTFPLQSTIPGWVFNASVRGALVERSFAALSRTTWIGSLTLTGAHALDARTILGLSFKLGGATSTQNSSATTVNSTQVGADLAILRLLYPDLLGTAHVGYELGGHQATISGIGSSFMSHTFRAGGGLEGVIQFGSLMIRPSLSAELLYRNRLSFTDGAGVLVSGSSTLDLDVTAGATISRDFLLPESALVVTPYLGADLALGYIATTPAPTVVWTPNDAFNATLKGGVRVAWDSGASLSVEGSVTRGANTTVLGISGGVTVPIQ